MFVFVILHYQAFTETVSEVNHIINDVYGQKRVVVVDNASPNGSGARLEKLFSDNKKVDIILNGCNSGYAEGNNLGIKFALEKYQPDYVIVANNDIEFRQNNFLSLIETSFQEQHFDIMGPKIFVPETSIYQNPKKSDSYTLDEVRKINEHSKKLLNQNTLLFNLRANLKKFNGLRKLVLKKRETTVRKINEEQFNIVLHGSLLIFSKKFFRKIAVPFDKSTFFYFETEILDRRMQSFSMISKYDPNLIVYHHQNTSTKQSFKTATAQQKFQLTNMVKSTQVFIDMFD